MLRKHARPLAAPSAYPAHAPTTRKGGDVARCEARNAKGGPCRAPESVVDPVTGRCPAHRKDGREAMRERGRRGAEATKRRWRGGGMDPAELPPLRTPQDAERWVERIGRAVAGGELSASAGAVAVRSAQVWLSARDVGALADRVKELEAQLKKLKRVRAA